MYKSNRIDALIPALNEQDTVGDVVRALQENDRINKIIVIDNGSTDKTAECAISAGAKVVYEPRRGLGNAIKSGLKHSTARYCLKTDADIDNWSHSWVNKLIRDVNQIALSRAIFTSPYDDFPVTNLVVKPFLKRAHPDWSNIPLPISGTFLFDRQKFNMEQISDNWAFDISLLVQCLEKNLPYKNHNIGVLSDKRRGIEHYIPMADDIIEYFIEKFWE